MRLTETMTAKLPLTNTSVCWYVKRERVSNGDDFSEYQVSLISKTYAINQDCRSLLTYYLECSAILRDSAVVRTCPRAIPLAMITMRKSIDEFSLLSNMGMVLRHKITTSRGGRE